MLIYGNRDCLVHLFYKKNIIFLWHCFCLRERDYGFRLLEAHFETNYNECHEIFFLLVENMQIMTRCFIMINFYGKVKNQMTVELWQYMCVDQTAPKL